jgi:hypothetical protein
MNILPFPVSTSCSGRTMPGLSAPELRERALANYYAAERRAGATPVEANERMHFFAQRLDEMNAEYERDLNVIRAVLERTV